MAARRKAQDAVQRVEVVGLAEAIMVLASSIRRAAVAQASATRYAARKDAAARRYEARVRAGIIHTKQRVEPHEVTPWTQWSETAEAQKLETSEREHLRWAYGVLSGATPATPGERVEAAVVYDKGQRAYGLPNVPRSA